MMDAPKIKRSVSLSHCEEWRDWMRQEEMGRKENKRHFKETVTRLGDSLESAGGGQRKENIPSQGEGPRVEGGLSPTSTV